MATCTIGSAVTAAAHAVSRGERRTVYVINYALITTEGPTAASVVTYLVPAVSVALGVTFLGEPIEPTSCSPASSSTSASRSCNDGGRRPPSDARRSRLTINKGA